MTLDKESLYGYGATGLKYFLDTGLTEPTSLERTIYPKEACLFYVGVLFLGESKAAGALPFHAAFALKDKA